MAQEPERPAPIYVCSLAALNAVVEQTAASHVLTVINPWSVPETPPGISKVNHLVIAVNDIEENQSGLVAPDVEHISEIISFAEAWDRRQVMVIHCLAGISRSSAAAFISLCAINSASDEFTIARALRSASVSASPNRLMVRLADQQLRRDGRMIAAIQTIGQGQPMIGATPFSIPSSIT